MSLIMKVLGVELAASEAKVVILDKSEAEGIQAEGYYKIPLAGLTQSAAISFKDAFIGLIQAHDPQKLVLNSRGKSGNFASGAMTFAMEGILLTIDDVEIVSVAGEFKHEVRQFEKSYDNQQAEQISLMV